MDLRARLRALDDRMVWTAARPSRGRRRALVAVVTLLLACVAVGWARASSWPRALVGVVVLTVALVAIGRYWFSPPRRDRD